VGSRRAAEAKRYALVRDITSNMSIALITENTIGLLWIIWFVSFVVIGVVSIQYFRTYPDVNVKRQFHRWWTIGYGVTFFLLIAVGMGASPSLLLFGPFIALIIYLNIRNITFCEACGKSVYNYFLVSKAEYCARCGARLPRKERRA
jgi:hypothetical protein